MKKRLLAFCFALTLFGAVLPTAAEAQRFRPGRPLVRPQRDEAEVEKRNGWVRQVLASAWTGVVGGALLFGLVTTGLVDSPCDHRIHPANDPCQVGRPLAVVPGVVRDPAAVGEDHEAFLARLEFLGSPDHAARRIAGRLRRRLPAGEDEAGVGHDEGVRVVSLAVLERQGGDEAG